MVRHRLRRFVGLGSLVQRLPTRHLNSLLSPNLMSGLNWISIRPNPRLLSSSIRTSSYLPEKGTVLSLLGAQCPEVLLTP